MKQRFVVDFVSQVSDRVTSVREDVTTHLVAQDDGHHEALVSLMRHLECLFVPVEPDPRFVDTLRAHLFDAVELPLPDNAAPVSRRATAQRRRLVGFAAVGSVASAVVVLAVYLLVARSRLTGHRSVA